MAARAKTPPPRPDDVFKGYLSACRPQEAPSHLSATLEEVAKLADKLHNPIPDQEKAPHSVSQTELSVVPAPSEELPPDEFNQGTDARPGEGTGPWSDAWTNGPTNVPTHGPAARPTDRRTDRPTLGPALGPANVPTQGPKDVPAKGPALGPTHGPAPTSLNHLAHTDIENPAYGMTEKQLSILLYLINQQSGFTKREDIMRALGVTEKAVKWTFKILKDRGFLIKTERYVKGMQQGVRYVLNTKLCEDFLKNANSPKGPTLGPANVPALGPANGLTDGPTKGRTDAWTGERTDVRTDKPYDDDLLYAYIRDHHLVEYFPDLYPNIYDLGLRQKDILEIARCWEAQSYDLTKLTDSFEAADWDLAHNEDNHIQSPASYIRKALKSGPYTFPRGFKPKRQIQTEQEAKTAEECRKCLEKVIDDCFYIWWTEMAPEERRKIDAEIAKVNKIMSSLGDVQKNILRQEWFRDNVYCEEVKKKLLAR